MDVIVLLDGRNTVASCLGWQTILNVDAGSVSCLGHYRSTLAEIARMDIEVARGAQVLVRWKQEKHPQLSFFVSRKSKLLISLLPHCVQMTDPLYRILMTCALFFGPFTRPCYCCSYRSRYSASYTPLTHLTRKQTTKTVQPTKHATADKRTIARSTVTAFNLQSFIEPPSHGTTITPLKHTLDSQNTDFKTRHRNQIPSFRHAKHKNSTDLSKHIWTLKNDNIDYSISWRVLSSSSP